MSLGFSSVLALANLRINSRPSEPLQVSNFVINEIQSQSGPKLHAAVLLLNEWLESS